MPDHFHRELLEQGKITDKQLAALERTRNNVIEEIHFTLKAVK